MNEPSPRKFSLFPKTLDQVIGPLTRPLLKPRGLAGTHVLTEWRRIAGGALAAHCVPEKLSFPLGKKTGGTLTVAVENGFATELQHMQPVILERLNTYFGYQAVTRLAISHSFPRRNSEPLSKMPPAARIAKDAKEVGDVADPELKKALQSLANSLRGQ